MEDEKIIALYWDRDEAAIRETDAKYGPYCFSVAAGILDSFQDCEECVSDTWLRAWNSMPPQKPALLKSFLAKITRNLSFNRYRADNTQKRGSGELRIALEELEGCLSHPNDPAAAVEGKELGRSIDRFLRTLPERDRNIFLYRYFYVHPFSQIASRYGLKEQNVRMILSRTRKKLKTWLEKEGYDL